MWLSLPVISNACCGSCSRAVPARDPLQHLRVVQGYFWAPRSGRNDFLANMTAWSLQSNFRVNERALGTPTLLVQLTCCFQQRAAKHTKPLQCPRRRWLWAPWTRAGCRTAPAATPSPPPPSRRCYVPRSGGTLPLRAASWVAWSGAVRLRRLLQLLRPPRGARLAMRTSRPRSRLLCAQWRRGMWRRRGAGRRRRAATPTRSWVR